MNNLHSWSCFLWWHHVNLCFIEVWWLRMSPHTGVFNNCVLLLKEVDSCTVHMILINEIKAINNTLSEEHRAFILIVLFFFFFYTKIYLSGFVFSENICHKYRSSYIANIRPLLAAALRLLLLRMKLKKEMREGFPYCKGLLTNQKFPLNTNTLFGQPW